VPKSEFNVQPQLAQARAAEVKEVAAMARMHLFDCFMAFFRQWPAPLPGMESGYALHEPRGSWREKPTRRGSSTLCVLVRPWGHLQAGLAKESDRKRGVGRAPVAVPM